jgi:hypothetical protein
MKMIHTKCIKTRYLKISVEYILDAKGGFLIIFI